MNIDEIVQLVGSQHIEILILRKQITDLQKAAAAESATKVPEPPKEKA